MARPGTGASIPHQAQQQRWGGEGERGRDREGEREGEREREREREREKGRETEIRRETGGWNNTDTT